MKEKDYTRHDVAVEMRSNGKTLAQIAKHLGVSPSTVKELLTAAENKDREAANAKAQAQENAKHWWFGLSSRAVWFLERAGFKSREDCMYFASDDMVTYRGSAVLPKFIGSKEDWQSLDTRIPKQTLNEIRAWLGFPPFENKPKKITAEEIILMIEREADELRKKAGNFYNESKSLAAQYRFAARRFDEAADSIRNKVTPALEAGRKLTRVGRVVTNKASQNDKVFQLITKYGSLEKLPSGRLSHRSRAEWLAWLDAFGIGPEYARRLMKEHARNANQSQDS